MPKVEKFKFELGFEEQLIQKTLNEAFAKISPSNVVREHVETQETNKQAHKFLAEQGLLGMLEPGRDMNLALSTILAKETGRRLVSFPVIEHLLGVFLLKQIEKSSEIGPFEVGDKLLTIGWNSNLEIGSVNNEESVTGTVGSIPFASEANAIIVAVKGKKAGEKDYVLLIDAERFQSQFRKMEVQDVTYPLYELTMQDTAIDMDSVKRIEMDVKEFYDVADLIIAAELLGIAQETLEMTLHYMTERKQFGVEIGKFQAVKHMLADMHLLFESSKVAVEFGAWSIENQGEDKDIISPIAKAYSSDAALRIVQDSIQLHGGVGYTWEHDLHFYLKRAYRLANMSDSPYEEREKIASYLLGDIG